MCVCQCEAVCQSLPLGEGERIIFLLYCFYTEFIVVSCSFQPASVLPFVDLCSRFGDIRNTKAHRQNLVLTNNCPTQGRNKQAKIIKIQSKFDVWGGFIDFIIFLVFVRLSRCSDLIKPEFCSYKVPVFVAALSVFETPAHPLCKTKPRIHI